ncbi:MAG: hypothetical protein ACI9WU_004148, partial [Myxococcota bacterium]
MRMRPLILTLAATLLLPLVVASTAQAQTKPAHETSCTDGLDEDADGLADCGDADCEKDPACKPGGGAENTRATCSDWIDNDGDGHVDCKDYDCQNAPGVPNCKGTWGDGPARANDGGTAAPTGGSEPVPELGPGQSVEDLIGTGGDADGERNDVLCSDGIDNDDDGKIDCADFGCRFDPTVRVCRGNPGMRFSIVANIGATYDLVAEEPDVTFSKLQLRSFGPIPLVQDSFYLISMRAERTPRLTFAMFQVPIGGGHQLNINSGSGQLSNQGVLSSAKQLLLSPPFYLTNAFDQRSSAAIEVGGPLGGGGIASYRAFAMGGAGLASGNVGGRFFGFDNTNFTYGGGAAFSFNLLGGFSRWDGQFLYTKAAPTLAIRVGARYDQRAQERYIAANGALNFRWNILAGAVETFYKREFEFES